MSTHHAQFKLIQKHAKLIVGQTYCRSYIREKKLILLKCAKFHYECSQLSLIGSLGNSYYRDQELQTTGIFPAEVP